MFLHRGQDQIKEIHLIDTFLPYGHWMSLLRETDACICGSLMYYRGQLKNKLTKSGR